MVVSLRSALSSGTEYPPIRIREDRQFSRLIRRVQDYARNVSSWLCVDGPGLTRVFWWWCKLVGCSYVFGLFARYDDRWP